MLFDKEPGDANKHYPREVQSASIRQTIIIRLTPDSRTVSTYDTEGLGVALSILVRMYTDQDTGQDSQDDEFTSRADKEGNVRQAVSSQHVKLIMGFLTVSPSRIFRIKQ
jgi:hypothetical protein